MKNNRNVRNVGQEEHINNYPTSAIKNANDRGYKGDEEKTMRRFDRNALRLSDALEISDILSSVGA